MPGSLSFPPYLFVSTGPDKWTNELIWGQVDGEIDHRAGLQAERKKGRSVCPER